MKILIVCQHYYPDRFRITDIAEELVRRGNDVFVLVGPRPERECFTEEFEKYIHGFKDRLKVKPGITGWAQVNGGYDLKPEEKIVYDIEYIEKRSLWMDVKILFKTIAVVFNHKGAK